MRAGDKLALTDEEYAQLAEAGIELREVPYRDLGMGRLNFFEFTALFRGVVGYGVETEDTGGYNPYGVALGLRGGYTRYVFKSAEADTGTIVLEYRFGRR